MQKVPGSFFGSAVLLFFLCTSHAEAAVYNCDYTFMMVPFSKLEFEVSDEGKLGEYVTVTAHGATHTETLASEVLGSGEKIHGWISKENPQNTIELIVYSEPKTEGETVIINNNMPFGKEVWGKCAVSN